MPTLEYKTALVELVAAFDVCESLLRDLGSKMTDRETANLFDETAEMLKARLNRFLSAEYRRTKEELENEGQLTRAH